MLVAPVSPAPELLGGNRLGLLVLEFLPSWLPTFLLQFPFGGGFGHIFAIERCLVNMAVIAHRQNSASFPRSRRLAMVAMLTNFVQFRASRDFSH